MENQRLLLWLALGLVYFMLWNQWQVDYAPRPEQPVAEAAGEAGQAPAPPADDLPSLEQGDLPDAPDLPPAPAAASGTRIRVITDVLDVDIDTLGGDLSRADLLQYPVNKKEPDELVRLLDDTPGNLYLLQSGLLGAGDSPAPDHRTEYQAAQTRYELGDADQIEVVLTWQEAGVRVRKVYSFARGSYRIGLAHELSTDEAWNGAGYVQIKRIDQQIKRSMVDVDSYSFRGPVFFDGDSYSKYKSKELRKRPLSTSVPGGWIASIEHHFVSAAVPPAEQTTSFQGRVQGGNVLMSAVGPTRQVAAGATERFEHALFVGPKLQAQLRETAPKLHKLVDYGMLAIISEPLFLVLRWIHDVVGNWGWSIIILTILIKLAFYKLTETSGRSMAKMRKLAPRLKALQERYKDDRQKLSQAMMEMYKNEGANPMAGCLPILVQMPVFLALYWVLLESVELRQAPFMLWIQDLSVRDPLFILPLAMGVVMFVQTKLNPTPPDPVQARIATFLPLVMTAFFAFFPAGLVLYWFFNSLLSVLQQWHINRVIERGA